ncbi:MAG TPA: WD40 repeat domain-containing protein, partial [Pyrinomonadaceae bacterium]
MPEAPTTKEMNGSGRHIYEFEIKKDEFFQVKARQAGVDVMLRLSDSQKNEVAGMDSPNGDLGFEILTFVPATTGIFTLEVVGFNPNAGQGNYIIQRLPRRAATENDRKRVLTERKFTEGVDAINSTDETVIKIALENLKGAMTGWQQLEDEGMVFITKDAINALNTILDQIQAEKTPQLVVKTSHGMITSIAFSLDNTLAAAGGSDGTIKLWEVGSGRQIRTLRGHQPTKEEDKKNPNASESLDPLINAFENIDSRGRLNTPFSVSFSPDGKTLASGSNARTIILWDVATGKSKITITSPVSVWFVAFSKDGQSLLARSEFKNDTAYRFYNAGNGEEIKENPPPLSQFNIPWQNQATKQEALSDPEDTNVKILNPNKTTFSLTGHTGGVRHAIFNPAGDILASGGWDRSVRLWDFKNKKLLKILGEHDSFISYLTFSADGKLLASGSEDGVVKIWDMTDKTQKMELRGYTSYVSPYGFGKNN